MCKPLELPMTPADSDYEGSLALLVSGDEPSGQEIGEAFELEYRPDCEKCMDSGCVMCR